MSNIPNSKGSQSSNAGTEAAERRSSERFLFSAVTEIIDIVSSTRIAARVSDLSLSGCYLDVINVFSPRTKIQVNIRHGNLQFEATGSVVYSVPGMGMGITFDPVGSEMASVLERWTAQFRGDTAPIEAAPEVNHMIQTYPRVERHILGRLIGLMVQKNMLTANEGAELLKELLENKE